MLGFPRSIQDRIKMIKNSKKRQRKTAKYAVIFFHAIAECDVV